MAKKIFITATVLGFIYASFELFVYFSYWGLGLAAVLILATALSTCIGLFSVWIFRKRETLLQILSSLGHSIAHTRVWQKSLAATQSRWPRTYFFLKKRLDKNFPSGLYTTICAFIAGFFLIQFTIIVFDILLKDPLYLADARTIHLIQAFISPRYASLFIYITTFANTSTVLLVSAITLVYLLMDKDYSVIRYFILSVGSGYSAYWLTKWIGHRPRPAGLNLITLPPSFSFPSGHAVIAICLYGFISYLIIKRVRSVWYKALTIAAFFLLVTAIGISRIYLGVHYPSDVIAGWYLGLLILTIAIAGYEINFQVPVSTSRKKISLASKVITLLLTFVPLGSIYTTAHGTTIITPNIATRAITLQDFIEHEPRYSENLLGENMEPLSFLILGEQNQIINTFNQAGWHLADLVNFSNVIHELSAIARNVMYASGPMTPAFYNTTANDLGFEKQLTDDATARRRHHARFWKTQYSVDGRPLWVGTASLDNGIEIGSKIPLPTHRIDPDIDREREKIFQELIATHMVSEHTKLDIVRPTRGINASGDSFFTDGKAYILWLQ